jgi:hypothetical protein
VNAAIIKRGTRYAVRLDLGRGPDGKRIYRYSLRLPDQAGRQQARTELPRSMSRAISHGPPIA